MKICWERKTGDKKLFLEQERDGRVVQVLLSQEEPGWIPVVNTEPSLGDPVSAFGHCSQKLTDRLAGVMGNCTT